MVSVIVPVYGVEKYIENCARSLFSQTFKDIEFVFVNDCTKDNSIKILENVISTCNNPNVIIVNNSSNLGCSRTREVGIMSSHGEYILFVDSDDWIEPDMVEKLYVETIRHNLDMVYCDFFEEYEGHSKECQQGNCTGYGYLESILRFKSNAYFWNRLIKRDLFKGVTFTRYNMLEDFAVVTQLVEKAPNIGYISNPLYHYRRSNLDSITTKEKNPDVAAEKTLNITYVHNWMQSKGLDVQYQEAWRNMAFNIVWMCFRHGILKTVGYPEVERIIGLVMVSPFSKDYDLKIYKQAILKIYAAGCRCLNFLNFI